MHETTNYRKTSERQFTQEFECEFLGSVDTLISATKLRSWFMKNQSDKVQVLKHMKIK